jgi:hypothetical protein
MSEQTEKPKNTFSEHVEITGNQLVDRLKDIVAEGNVRRIILRAPDDTVMMQMNLTASAVVGGVVALSAPWLAAIGAVAALVTKMRVEIVREVDANDKNAPPARPASTGTEKVRIQLSDDE